MRVHLSGAYREDPGLKRMPCACMGCAIALWIAVALIAAAGFCHAQGKEPGALEPASAQAGEAAPAAAPSKSAQTKQEVPAELPAQAAPPARNESAPVPYGNGQIAADCASLFKLATELKSEVDKTTREELSVTVVRGAEQIEQLARKVREEGKSTGGRN